MLRALRAKRIGAGARRAAIRHPAPTLLLKIIVPRLSLIQRLVMSKIVDRWTDRHPVGTTFRHRGATLREDARVGFKGETIADLKVNVAETFNPTKLNPELRFAGARISKQGLLQFEQLVPITNHTDVGVDAAIEAFRSRNVALITDIPDKMLDQIGDVIDQAEQEGWRVEELREKIQERFGVARSRAELIARDQTLKLSGQLQRMRQTNAGITQYIWTTSGDSRVREDHAELDGETFTWGDPPITNEEGDRNEPGEDYQCRCTAYPVIDTLNEEDSTEAESESDQE